MGGKSKQAQRTKNNSRPSNSGRSAELLGSAIPSFVGFATHSDFGIVPLAPGFSTSESLPDTFDSTVSSQFQLILRKMSKKDPVTKVKALQEFGDLISDSDIEVVKTILPLWPKFYHNLANDVEHRVREAAQNAQAAIVTKVGKSIAPYLKQLAPVWISSQFDNYAPVATIASTTFKSSFSSTKVQEVFTFCQNDIIDYITKNLTYHTASTLSNSKTGNSEEAENKYIRIVICSLKSLALFLEQTAGKYTSEIEGKLKVLLQNQKFWNFSKHKISSVRSAWFEALYSFLQNSPDLIESNKEQVIQITFLNMDDNDPLTLPNIWGCILLVQTVFSDWNKHVNFKKVLLPKLSSILKDGTCATAIYPNLLPFISKFSNETVPNYTLNDFYTNIFDNIKQSLTLNLKNSISKGDASATVSAFYECLRYVIQIKASECARSNNSIKELNFCTTLVNDHIIDILKWNIVNENITTKYVFLHISSLIAYWSQTSNTYPIYQELLKLFWSQLLKLIRENQELEENIDKYVKEFVEFIQNLYYAAPFPHDTKVKFSDEENGSDNLPKKKNSVLPLQKDLKAITVELTRSMLDRMSNKKSTNYVVQLKILSDMFGDADFYCKITNKNNLYTAVELFTEFLMKCSPPLETIVDIIFEILMLLEKTERMDHLNKLLKVPNTDVQQWILQRLLSYPLCVEPEIRGILSQKHVTELIQNIASEVIKENSKEKFNLLHKCFFQIDSGEILINAETVEGITRIMSEPLSNESLESMLDTCGSFIAQIMPVICSINSTKELQRDIFIKLFRFSVNLIESEYLSEDTLWEITTCWQDALSSNDITLDDELLAICCEIIDKRLTESDIISVPEINNIADMTAKLILCSTENITSEEERYKKIDSVIDKLLSSPKYLQIYKKIEDLCAYFELIEGKITLNCLNDDYMPGIPLVDVKIFFRKQLLNFSTIFKLTCNEKNEKQIELQEVAVEEDHEFTEDYFDPNEHLLRAWSDKIYGYIITSVNVAAIGESLMLNSSLISEEVEFLILNLSEKVNLVLNHSADCFISSIKSKLFSKIIENETSWTRTVPFLLSTNPFYKNENGSILLYEDSCNFVLENGNYLAYINITNIMLPKLEAKTLPVNYNVLMDNIDLIVKETSLRLFVTNHFTSNYNEISDRKIIAYCLDLITEVAVRQQTLSEFLLYNEEIDKAEFSKVTTVVEFINFLTKVLEKFPAELTIQHWDTVRLGLSSWVLSVSKSIERFLNPKVAMFTTAVYKLFAVLTKFIEEEKRKSSTQMLSNVIDEWQNLFSREVNLVLFKCFYKLVSNGESKRYTTTHSALLDLICPCTEYLDYEIIFNACKSGFKISIDDILSFTLDHLSNDLHSVRMASINITHIIAKFLITSDTEKLEKRPEIVDQSNSTTAPKDDWHYLSKCSPFIEKYTINIEKYMAEFSYKLTELPDLQPITHHDALPYLFLWDCIIYICSKAPAELRSLYAMWITENKYEHTLLNFLFRAMPVEILKNHDSKVMSNDVFKALTSTEVKDVSTTVERYACHFYTQTLRHLPAVVRKWWNATNTRQKTFVDKLTTNFVSNLICQEELRAIVNKKEKHENMQVTVHTSTREVVAVYSIDEARMELVITLAQNHPLGAVKVESGKQIGGRGQSRNVGMQLTIFLTHQNGSIFDGLSLWKKNLDKKFEGVEECYVCYTVIHQDTCQLPKLSCKTCKKKFHGPCLYKWFTTSSKSTCPICRNVF